MVIVGTWPTIDNPNTDGVTVTAKLGAIPWIDNVSDKTGKNLAGNDETKVTVTMTDGISGRVGDVPAA